MTDPNNVVVWIFLAFFVLTGLVTLAALPKNGLLQLDPYYKKKLFVLLLLEVVGCVIVFGKDAMASRSAQRDVSHMVVDYSQGWHAQYAEKGWRARYRFVPTSDGRMTMLGSTYVVSDSRRADKPIINWESTEPFRVDQTSSALKFKARRVWTDFAATIYPELRHEVGKKTDVEITLFRESALRGVVANGNSVETWGLTLTPAPR